MPEIRQNSDLLVLTDARERWVVRGLQAILAAIMVYGLATGQLGMASNGALTLSVTFVPAILQRTYGYSMDVGLVLWLTIAVVLHSVGALGPYRDYSWYDNITHTVSASLIAGVGYAVLRALEVHSDEIDVPKAFRGLFIVVFVLAMGIVWELVEFASVVVSDMVGARAPLIVFGIDDIITDLLFNTAGAVVVALWGTESFRGLASFFRRRLRRSRGR
ncbi:hypothetical protein VB773_22845 [Haloarculaceae archaeon H-GB2-1]|nr:hypothetical protein [Haloarculaceae archaeon H-GB1-1]MEA5389602.1 hypothetical protein [Haloarculaceae archaeon H-GB11]MEA5410133.1 hypothetical protein [Haloarculaceae archaeon H-GB2-1]